MTKPVQVLDRVTIRFAGDSGDGMQLTGDRFTSETAAFGNDVSTLPDFPAEIRAPAGSIAGVSGFQLHFADHDILTPGDAPDVLVAMNPAALKANLGDLPKGASLIVNTDSFSARNLDKAGYAGNPLEDGTLADYQVHPVPLTSMTLEALKEYDISKKEAERAKNMFALGLMSWLYHRPTEATVAYLEKKFASRPDDRQGERHRLQGRLELRRDDRGLRRLLRDQAGQADPGDLPEHLREPGPGLRAGRGQPAVGAAAVPRRLPDHPRLRHPPRALQAQGVRGPDLPGRGRDRRGRGGPGGGLRRGAGGHHLERPRDRPQGRDHRPRRLPGAAPAGDRHPAQRALDRDADQDRAGRPAPGAVRPQRRGAGAGGGSLHPLGLLPRRRRGGPDRPQVPDPGGAAVGRLPGQRVRAVAAAGRGLAARHLGLVRHRAQPRGRLLALPARRDHPGPAVGGPGHARPRAPHRRAGEGRRDRQHQLRPRQPRPHDQPARGQGGRDRGRHPAPGGRPPGRVAAAGAGLGLDLRADRGRRAPGPGLGGQGVRGPPAPPQPLPGQPRRGAGRLRPGADPGDEPGPAPHARPRPASWSTPSATTRSGGCRSRPRSWPTPSSGCWTKEQASDCAGQRARQRRRPEAHRQGLQERPGGPLVPGLRGLRDPLGRAGLHALAGDPAGSGSCSSRASAAPRASPTT